MTTRSSRPRENSSRRAERVVAGRLAGDQFDQAHHRYRVEEVQSANALGPARLGGELHDRDRRGVRSQDRVGVAQRRVQLPKHLELGRLVLDHRLDHQLTVGQIGKPRAELEPLQRRGELVRGELVRAQRPLQRSLDAPPARLHQLLALLVDSHAATARAPPLRRSPEPIRPQPTTPIRSTLRPPLSAGHSSRGPRGAARPQARQNAVAVEPPQPVQAPTRDQRVGQQAEPVAEHDRAQPEPVAHQAADLRSHGDQRDDRRQIDGDDPSAQRVADLNLERGAAGDVDHHVRDSGDGVAGQAHRVNVGRGDRHHAQGVDEQARGGPAGARDPVGQQHDEKRGEHRRQPDAGHQPSRSPARRPRTRRRPARPPGDAGRVRKPTRRPR